MYQYMSDRKRCGSLTSDGFVQEKAKKNAWQKIADEGVSAGDAQKRYVKLVNDLKEKYGFEG